MAVTEESEGRLNAFANEPKIEVINKSTSDSKGSLIVRLCGLVLLVGLISFSLTIK